MKVGGGVKCLAVASGLAAVAAGLFGAACGEVQLGLDKKRRRGPQKKPFPSPSPPSV